MDHFVTVATFFDTNEAYIARGLLESEGIETRVFDEHAAAYVPVRVIGVRLAVRQSDLERAKEILSPPSLSLCK